MPTGLALKRSSLRMAIAIPPAGACLVHPHVTNASGGGRHPKVRIWEESSGPALGTMVPPRDAPCPAREGGQSHREVRASAAVITASAPSVRLVAGSPPPARARKGDAGSLRWARQRWRRTGSVAAQTSG